jgi:hypothetical protein
MFDELPGPDKKDKRPLLYILYTVIILLAVVTVLLAIKIQANHPVRVPLAISKQADFTLYLPKKLPGNYKLVSNSFVYTEGTVVFKAEDSTGATIAISEQKKPAKFDFNNFYKQNLIGARTLKNADYPAVTGKTAAGERRLLSIVLDDTWIIATTPSPITDDDFYIVAQSMSKQ